MFFNRVLAYNVVQVEKKVKKSMISVILPGSTNEIYGNLNLFWNDQVEIWKLHSLHISLDYSNIKFKLLFKWKAFQMWVKLICFEVFSVINLFLHL